MRGTTCKTPNMRDFNVMSKFTFKCCIRISLLISCFQPSYSVTHIRLLGSCRKLPSFTFSESRRGCQRPVQYIAALFRCCACIGDSRAFLQGRQHPPQRCHHPEKKRRHRTVAQRSPDRVSGYAALRCFSNKTKNMRTSRIRWRRIHDEKKK
jgi:hypothetical protein